MLYETVSFTCSRKKSKEISLQGFVEESNLKELFIGAAYYVNLASDIERLPLRAFIVKERKKAREQGALTNRAVIKAAVITADHQKERRKW